MGGEESLISAKTPPHLITLILLSGLSVASLNMFIPSLTNISESLDADYSLVTVSLSGYLAITALLHLIMGPLSDRFGRRPVLLVAFCIFIVASIGCYFSTNIWMFLFFRLLQSTVACGVALSSAILRDIYPADEAASKIGYVAMAWAIAPMVGPMLGGALDEFFGWRANFAAFAIIGVIVLVVIWIDLGETNKYPSATFSQQLKTYPELFTSRRFWGYALTMSFSTGLFYVFITGAPLVAQTVLAMSPAELGFYIGTITAGFVVGNFLSGRYAKRFALTTMMIAGRLVATVGLTVGLLLFLSGHINVYTLFGSTIFAGLGNGLTMPSASSGVVSVRPKIAGSAAGLSGSILVSVGVLATTLTGVAITEHNGPFALLGLMLVSVLLGLAAAIYVLWIDKCEAQLENQSSLKASR